MLFRLNDATPLTYIITKCYAMKNGKFRSLKLIELLTSKKLNCTQPQKTLYRFTLSKLTGT